MTNAVLNPKELLLLRTVFQRHSEIQAVTIFGSRAKGTHSPGSDVDLSVRGLADDMQAQALASELDELPLPYHFDVLAFEAISHAPLREHIERVGIVIYPAADR